jgi:hypothetical protein
MRVEVLGAENWKKEESCLDKGWIVPVSSPRVAETCV